MDLKNKIRFKKKISNASYHTINEYERITYQDITEK